MEFIKTPNTPYNGAVALVDSRSDGPFTKALNELGLGLIPVPPSKNLYHAVACHPDMVLHDLGEGYMIYEPDTARELLDILRGLGISLIKGSTKLVTAYPGSVSYNAARVGKYVFHNFRYTDKILLEELEKRKLNKIHVKQGYSKCSICIVDENSIITSDTGIHRAARENGLDSLLIPPQKNIVLKGLDYGFIGGSTGKIAKDKLCIFGDIRRLEAFEDIIKFTEKKGVEVLSLGEEEVTDFGSLIVIKEK